MDDKGKIAVFIERWRGVAGSERANYQLFVSGLCDLLDLSHPEPAREETRDNLYVFERRVTFAYGDGTTSNGFIDCYKRGAFVLEAKRVKAGAHTKGFDDALLRARAQAENYARALPASEGRPPFVAVVDVGHVIELYADFTRSGATYTPFPDARSHRIRLDDLHDAAVRERLRTLWLDPMALDPARVSAKVTREVAVQLATVARSLEAAGHAPELVAAFLTRCLFSMFAEDVELLPRTANGDGAFVDLLKRFGDQPDTLSMMLRALWTDMDRGGFCAALAKDVLKFNGKLFKAPATGGYVLPLARGQIDGLLAAARANWREVEPAIFGTLLERALQPDERHALGAHYTPRAYVERLVLPTVVQPLRADWADAQAAAVLLATEGKMIEARAEVRRFHHQLCTTRVLDPACGSGNFLYVTLEHLKRLEGEVLNQLQAFGEAQDRLGFAGETVTLQQLRGIEINPRAAALAELVLWIGFLQWHIRTFGNASVAEPVIHNYGNIECRDAVLAYDRVDYVLGADGKAVTRWDGVHFKKHPVTGEDVPDEACQTPLEKYTNPRKAKWPSVEFIVGNPPFIGNKRMRIALGSEYVDALRATWSEVPESADFVMFWWQRAAETVRTGAARRFGLITTNSVTQTFNRRVVDRALLPAIVGKGKLTLVFAIADHPWVDSAQGAAVRIAMTVGSAQETNGLLLNSVEETEHQNGEIEVKFDGQDGEIHSDLTIGAKATSCVPLRANVRLSYMGVILCGDGFFVDGTDAVDVRAQAERDGVVALYLSGTDLAKAIRGRAVVDFTGLTSEMARQRSPVAYQRILDRVKPVRDQSNRAAHRKNWWLYGEKRPLMRLALDGLDRYIATARTSKFRLFQFVEPRYLAESNVIVVASDDALHLGVLSSQIHIVWSARMGATLEDRPHYTNSTTFETFPFPNLADQSSLAAQIAATAEELDAHRKRQQAAHASLSLTDMYNVLDAVRLGRPLTAKEKLTHTNGLVSVLAELHDRLDALVLEAYGWTDLAPALIGQPGGTLPWPERPAAQAAAEEELLVRLVALNAERAAEESRGTVRWLRPEFQDPAQRGAAPAPVQVQEELDIHRDDGPVSRPTQGDQPSVVVVASKRPWPVGVPEQIKAVAELLRTTARPLGLTEIEASFTARGRWRDRLPTLLETLEALGRARRIVGPAETWQAR